ncbi:MAG: hypothetical protein AAGA02_16595 [Bacteroidota bacterium]
MKITKKLLERHGLGLCTDEEKKAIEQWFDTLDDPSLDLKIEGKPEFEKEYTWSKMTQAIPQLEDRMNLGKAKQIQFVKNMMRYAAAACFVIGVFFVGRVSVGTAYAIEPKDPTADHLFIFGYKDAIGNLPGNNFKIKFDGSLRLYNNSVAPKRINVGDTSFMLTSRKSHYLIGNSQNPELIVEDHYKLSYKRPPSIEGYFSIQRLYE